MKRKLYERLIPLLVQINKRFVNRDNGRRDGLDQVVDFVVKAVEERIDRMSQTEGEES